MLSEVFGVIAPVVATALVGYLWVKVGRRFDRDGLTDLTVTVAFPALIFDSLASLSIEVEALGLIMLGSLMVHLAIGAAGALVLAGAGLPQRVYFPALAFRNNGNFGLPVCLLAFGDAGLGLGIGYLIIGTVLMHSVSPALASGRVSLAGLVRRPILWAVVLGLGFAAAGVGLPEWLSNSLGMVGAIAIPLMLLSLGASLAVLPRVAVRTSIGLALWALASGLAAGFGVAALLGLDGVARGVLVVQAAMPPAVFNHVYAARFDAGAPEVASLIVTATVMAFITCPLVLAVVR